MPEYTRSTAGRPPHEVYPIVPQERGMVPDFAWWDRVFSKEECEDIVRVGRARTLVRGTIGNGANNEARDDPEYRSVWLRSFQMREDAVHWMYDRIRDVVIRLNDAHYDFDLLGLCEPIQFLEYRHGGDAIAGHYDWHRDFGGGFSSWRKASVVVNLSDPAQYTGCRLKLFTEREYEPGHSGQGDVVLFPSWTPHCVTDIESGTRNALVAWFGGRQFR